MSETNQLLTQHSNQHNSIQSECSNIQYTIKNILNLKSVQDTVQKELNKHDHLFKEVESNLKKQKE